MSSLGSVPESSQSPYMLPSTKRASSMYFNIGAICALVGLFVFPEIFGSAAIILGAYTWKLESDKNSSRGLLLIIFGIVAMLVGIYYTSYYGLYNILP